jgi:hypothetical protein
MDEIDYFVAVKKASGHVVRCSRADSELWSLDVAEARVM